MKREEWEKIDSMVQYHALNHAQSCSIRFDPQCSHYSFGYYNKPPERVSVDGLGISHFSFGTDGVLLPAAVVLYAPVVLHSSVWAAAVWH